MIILNGSQWAGTEEAYNHALLAMEHLNARSSDREDEDDEESKPAYRVEDGVAFVNVKGPMLNMDLPDWFAEAYGVTTYPGLQRQFAAIQQDPAVERVVLDVDSGGGHVSGLHETVEALRTLKAEKPVATYAGSSIASAAYWLGSVGETITMSPVGTAGSIGVIAVHMSAKAAYEQDGYKPTVMRSGSKKALGHLLEDFSEEARAEMQKSLNFAHKNFMQAVSENRGIAYALIEAGIGDGRCFYGEEAKEVGLVDNVGSFASFLEGWKPKSSIPTYQTGGFVAATIGELDMNLEEALTKVEALQGELSTTEAALAAAETKAASAEAAKAELATINKALAASTAALEADVADYSAVLEKNITTKAVALGTKVLMPEDLAGKKKLNAQLETEFLAAFPAGGVAAVASEETAKVDETPAWLKRVVR